MTYEPVKLLYKKFKEYITEGQKLLLIFPFLKSIDELRILAISKNEDVTIALLNEKFN